jgi:hypothetical protein
VRWLPFILLASAAACRHATPDEYLHTELKLVRAGVDIEGEEQAVRRVLGQRQMQVVRELRGPGFVALGAESLGGRLTAVRVITARGVVVAEDGQRDDLFAPSSLALLDDFGPTFGEYVLVALQRTSPPAEHGCVSWFRILPDGRAVRGVLDASALGSRACVSSIAPGPRGRLYATVAWPGLTSLTTPVIDVELGFAQVRLGEAPALVPVARVSTDGDWLEHSRARLERVGERDTFSGRHVLGVARAALALLSGLDRERQLGLYRATVGAVPPGSFEATWSSEALAHIERGWVDEEPPAPAQPAEGADPEVPDDAEVIEPEPRDDEAEAVQE